MQLLKSLLYFSVQILCFPVKHFFALLFSAIFLIPHYILMSLVILIDPLLRAIDNSKEEGEKSCFTWKDFAFLLYLICIVIYWGIPVTLTLDFIFLSDTFIKKTLVEGLHYAFVEIPCSYIKATASLDFKDSASDDL